MTQLFTVALSSIILLTLLWLFLFEYRAYRVRVLRFHLFAARDRLFSAARSGALSFDDRAYGMARTVINGLLVQAEALSIPHMLLMSLITKSDDRRASHMGFDVRFAEARSRIGPRGQAAVDEALKEVHFCVLSHALHISGVFFLPVLILKLWIGVRVSLGRDYAAILRAEKRSSHRSLIDRQMSVLDDEAYGVGASKECLAQAA